jgi:hypothetical protein
MDTQSLIKETKARFSHNAAKAYLKEKYKSKLIVADQGGLWLATPELIGFLASEIDEHVILLDTYENPVFVNRLALHTVLDKTYRDTMNLWFSEWKELENKR